MSLIQVDQSKCTRCGLCVADCPTGVIAMHDGPQAQPERHCIACGHCVAVCPHGALDHEKTPLANQIPQINQPVLDEATAAQFLRARRSVRQYRPEQVPRAKVQQLLDVARQAPTGGNSQGVAFYVYDDPETLQKIIAATIDWMEEKINSGSPGGAYYAGTVATYRNTGRDVILRGAPCLVAAATPKKMGSLGRDNAHFALSYAELFAPSIGLGTCWAGFFEGCASSGYQPLLQLLQLPETLAVGGGIMVGFPKVSYHRLVDRAPLQVTWQ